MSVAVSHEEAVADRFTSIGWQVIPFGQAQLTTDCRNALRRWRGTDGKPSLVRWLPDLLAYTTEATPSVALVDAKGSISRTANHSVEIASIKCDLVISQRLNTPTYYVFEDFGVLTPDEVVQYGSPGPPPRNGSGTPYYLVAKSACHSFYDVFALDDVT